MNDLQEFSFIRGTSWFRVVTWVKVHNYVLGRVCFFLSLMCSKTFSCHLLRLRLIGRKLVWKETETIS